MATTDNQRLKLMYLLDILRERTDEEHSITMEEILGALSQMNVHAERKAIYRDIQTLNEYEGVEIVGEKEGKIYKYRLITREFEIAELRLLVDAVQSSRFITTRKSNELIKKLEHLASNYEARSLNRQVFVSGRIKSMNETIFINIDAIHRAINENVNIRFKYFNWTPDKEQEFRHDGADYVVSPFGLIWDDENYYLVAYDASYDELRHYRVDKMKNIRVMKENREGKELFSKRDMARYTEQRFGMFDGNVEKVTLLCENHFAGVIIDRFGKDVMMIRTDKEHFEARVDVAASDLFLGWVAGLGEGVQITAPADVKDRMREMAERLSKMYT